MQALPLDYRSPESVENCSGPAQFPCRPSIAGADNALDSVAFTLFVLVNAVLFIRPAEIVPSWERMPFYEVLILSCLLFAFGRVLPQFNVPALLSRPISVCVLGLLVSAVLSRLVHGDTWYARACGVEFLKLVIYYLLLVGVLNTPERLQRFLTCLGLFVLVLTVLALLQYHHFIDIPSLAAYKEGTGRFDEWTGEPILLARLCSTGIFNDPNDLCLILIFGAMVFLYRVVKGSGPLRLLGLLPVMIFGYALIVTHSRGGFLAMLVGLMVLFVSRFGWQRAVPIAAAILPVVFVVFAGRATQLSASEGTGQDRIKIWSDGLQLFRSDPIFGIGMNRYVEEADHVAHNSFIQCYTELGLLGGTLFITTFYYAVKALHRIGQQPGSSCEPDLLRLRPFILAIVAAYATGYMSLSRSYSVPTFLVLGLVTAYVRLVCLHSLVEVPRLSLRFVQHSIVVSIGFIVVAYLFVRTFVRFG